MEFKDREVQAAYVRLLDALCSWERSTSREITVLVIPHTPDEPICVSSSGKPWRDNGINDVMSAIGFAFRDRLVRRAG